MKEEYQEEENQEKKRKRKKINSTHMKKIIGTLLAGLSVISVGGLMQEGVKVQEYQPKAEKGYCTVLVYMDGSDLESDYEAATDDLLEIEQALQDNNISEKDIHIVVEAGGAKEWKYDAMQDKEYGRFCVSAEGPFDVEPMEARNMGEADTLTDFINYGTQSYPAEHYGFVFWNHGAGQIAGFGSDSQFDDASLSLHEIESGINHSSMQQLFSFVSLDACLMGNIELAAVLEGKAEYLIASEELEPQCGYDYSWLGAIREEMVKDSSDIGEAVGEAMIDTYGKYYQNGNYKLTLSLIDLKKYEDFHDCFHQIVEEVAEQADDTMYQQLGKKRKTLQGFGSSGGAFGEIVDMMDFMEMLINLIDDDLAYKRLLGKYDSLVPEKFSKGYAEEPSGLSIYLPSGDNEWIMQDMSVYKTITFCNTYKSFLKNYRSYLAAESHISWHSVDKNEQEITVQVEQNTMDDITNAYLAVFCDTGKEGEVYLLSTDSDVVFNRAGYLKAEAEKQYWGLKNEILCLIETVDTEDYTEYMAPVLYNNELCVMHISFSEKDENGKIAAITPISTKKKEYVLKDGDVLYPLYPLEQTEESGDKSLLPDDIDAVGENDKEVDTYVKSGDIYIDSYYIGNKISIESIADGDAKLMLSDIDTENCMFGFMLWDSKQRLYYTDFISK